MSKKTWVITIIVSLVVVMAAGGATWYVMNQKFQDQKKESDKRIQELGKKINELEKKESEEEKLDQGDLTVSDAEQEGINSLVESYKTKIKKCSGTSPDATFIPCVENNLSDILDQNALNQVIGKEVYIKTTSSPSPGEIEITSTEKKANGEFLVRTKFYINLQGENTGYYPTDFSVSRIDDKYMITHIETGDSTDL